MSDLRIDLSSIDTYAKCPRKYSYSLNLIEGVIPEGKSQLLKRIVSNAYFPLQKMGQRKTWRNSMAEIDKYCFGQVDTTNDEQTRSAYKESLSLIGDLKKNWYDFHYMADSVDGISDIPVSLTLPSGVVVSDTLDLILYSKSELILCYFSNIEQPAVSLYNNIRLRGQALLLTEAVKRDVTSIRYYTWIDKVEIKEIRIRQPQEFMNRTYKTISHIVDGIQGGVFYPSVNEQCLRCPFNKKCSF